MADSNARVDGRAGGDYQDDVVILNGVELAVESPIRGGMVSEFSTGMKIGKATYDEREHAFWISLEDFSGGMGFRYMDVREAGGTHWDNDGGVDLRRPRHITLPGRRNTYALPAGGPALQTLFFVQDSMLYSDISGAGRLYIGILEDIWWLDTERSLMTKVYDGSAQSNNQRIGRIIEGVDTSGGKFLIATGRSALGGTGLEMLRTNDGDNWDKSSSSNEGFPVTPSANASFQTSDCIWWDGLVITHAETDQIVGSANGVAYEVDSAAVLNDHWRTGSIVIDICGTAMAPWGADAVYFINKGKLFILDWYVHNAVEVRDLGDRNVLRVGTVWNGSVIVTDGWNVWEYNPGNAQTVRRIGLFGVDGPPLSARSETGHAGISDDYHIINFIPGTSDLFALCRSLTANPGVADERSWRLAVYNGVGWSWYGPEVAASQPYAATLGYFPLGINLQSTTRAIDVICLADQNDASPTVTLHTIHLPPSGDVPSRGPGQRFEDGPLTFETGWFDGGFAELEGALLRLTVDAFHLTETETVKVEYRLNNNEDATYITLGTYKLDGQEFWFGEIGHPKGIAFKSVQFRISLDRGIGVQFSDTQTLLNDADFNNSEATCTVDDSSIFRIGDVIRMGTEQMQITAITAASELLTVTRGFNSTSAASHANNTPIFSEDGVTPELKSLVLVYDKVPRFRSAWTIRLDVSRMINRSFNIDEETATTENIWAFLKNVVNTPTLAHIIIPSIEPGGIYVRITDMPATIDEFREQAGGRGYVELQVLETVGP